jgi:hypothetical protein
LGIADFTPQRFASRDAATMIELLSGLPVTPIGIPRSDGFACCSTEAM